MKQTYTYEQVRQASIDYFGGDELAAEVFAGKYALRDPRDPNQRIFELTPEDMHRRMAKEFARIESRFPNGLSEETIFTYLKDWVLIPQGSPMAAIGNDYQFQSLSNCFVIASPEDSYGGICKTDEEQAQIMKRRGGVGFDLSTIRPKGLPTSNAAVATDGIGVFMNRYASTCREVAQGGRRGALMMTLSVHHPEVRTFINIKRDRTKVTGANISLRLSEEFMTAVSRGEKVHLRFPTDPNVEHTMEEWTDARALWDEIVEAAWACAEPGLLFWDTIKKRSPADAYASVGFGTTSTNPCGELLLSPYDSCRLLLVNLTKFVHNPFTSDATFDEAAFDDAVQVGQRLMDDLVELELEAVDRIISKIDSDPESELVKMRERELWLRIKDAAVKGRRTGLGVTGLGDALAYEGVVYGTERAVKETERIYRLLALGAYRSSVRLAKERGAFPVYDSRLEAGHPFIEQVLAEDEQLRIDHQEHGRRNIALTTTSPAGSTSIVSQTSSGIECAFLLHYSRRRKISSNDHMSRVDFVDNSGDKWQMYDLYHHGFKKWMDVTGHTVNDVHLSPYWHATSADVDWVKKIDMQAAAQKWVCHSISNTTNVPANTSLEIVKQIYMRGWQTGCKGVTIYRAGTRDGVLIEQGEASPGADVDEPQSIPDPQAPKRPPELPCDIHRTTVKGTPYVILVGLFNDRPYELFCGLSDTVDLPKKFRRGMLVKNGKQDGISTYNLQVSLCEGGDDDDVLVLKDVARLFDNPTYGAFTRTLSIAMRHGVPLPRLVEQLRKDKSSDVTSFSAAVARILSKHYIPDGTQSAQEKTCSECGGSSFAYQSGCSTCIDCGASRCG